VNEADVIACHQFIDINQDKHALVQDPQTDQIVGLNRIAELGAGRICSIVSVVTSNTLSTTMPITLPLMFNTIMIVS